MDSIKITLETLYDFVRNEKKRADLQQLEAAFLINVAGYVREKQALLKEKEHDASIFAAGERDKLEYEVRSIKRILKEIYELREKKIIDIALNKSKTGSEIIDTSAMLREEKEFYQQLLRVLDLSRQKVLFKLYNGELPVLLETTLPEIKMISADKEKTSVMTMIRFIHPTPSFVWKDLKVYGPYGIGVETEIFTEVAELLIRKKRAERV